MGDVDWFKVFGIDDKDHERWEEMQEDADKRKERGGGIGRIADKAAESGVNFAEKVSKSRMDAAHHKAHNDDRAMRPKRKRKVVEVEEQTDFMDEPGFD